MNDPDDHTQQRERIARLHGVPLDHVLGDPAVFDELRRWAELLNRHPLPPRREIRVTSDQLAALRLLYPSAEPWYGVPGVYGGQLGYLTGVPVVVDDRPRWCRWLSRTWRSAHRNWKGKRS